MLHISLLLQTLIYSPQANLRGHAEQRVASVLFRLWMALWNTRRALQLQHPEAGPGALSRRISCLEDNQSLGPEFKDRIGSGVTPMEMTAHMVRDKLMKG